MGQTKIFPIMDMDNTKKAAKIIGGFFYLVELNVSLKIKIETPVGWVER